MNDRNKLPENLRFYRKKNKLNQKDIAEKIGVVQQTYSNYETGTRTPSIDILLKLAEIYNISLDTLTGADEAKDAKKEDMLLEETGSYEQPKRKNLSVSEEEETLVMLFRKLTRKARREVLDFLDFKNPNHRS